MRLFLGFVFLMSTSFMLFPTMGLAESLSTLLGSGILETETRPLEDFDTLVLSSPGKLKLIQGNENKLIIEGEKNVFSEITSIVTQQGAHKRLLIKLTKNNVTTTRPLKYILQFKKMHAITLNSTVILTAHDSLNFEKLALNLKGTSEVYLALKAQELQTTIWGNSILKLSGETKKQDIKIYGYAKYSALKLFCQDVKLHVNGSSILKLLVLKNLDVFSSGVTKVIVRGNPDITQRASGSVKITPIGG